VEEMITRLVMEERLLDLIKSGRFIGKMPLSSIRPSAESMKTVSTASMLRRLLTHT